MSQKEIIRPDTLSRKTLVDLRVNDVVLTQATVFTHALGITPERKLSREATEQSFSKNIRNHLRLNLDQRENTKEILDGLMMYRDACNDPDNRFLRESIVFEVFDTLAQVSQQSEGKLASLDQRPEFYRGLEIISCLDPNFQIAQAWEKAKNNPANPNLKINPLRRATFLNFLSTALDTQVFSLGELTELAGKFKDMDVLPHTINDSFLGQAAIRFWGAVGRQQTLGSSVSGFSLDTAVKSITNLAIRSSQMTFALRTLAEFDERELKLASATRSSGVEDSILFLIPRALEDHFFELDKEAFKDITYLVKCFAEGDYATAIPLLENTLNMLNLADRHDGRNEGNEDPLLLAMTDFGHASLNYIQGALERATDEQKDQIFFRRLTRFLTSQAKIPETGMLTKFSENLIANIIGSLREVYKFTPRRVILQTYNDLRESFPNNERLVFDFFSFISQGVNGDLLLAREPLEDFENIRLWQQMMLYLNKEHRETARGDLIALYQNHPQADERFYRNFREDVGSEGHYNVTTLDSVARIYIGLVMGDDLNEAEKQQWEDDLIKVAEKSPILLLANRRDLDLSRLHSVVKSGAEKRFEDLAQKRFDSDHQKRRSAEQILADLGRMPVDDQVRMYEQLLRSEDIVSSLKALLTEDSLLLRSSHTESLLDVIGTSGLAALSIDARKLLEVRIRENEEKYIDLVEMAAESDENEVLVWAVGLLSDLDKEDIEKLDLRRDANYLIRVMNTLTVGGSISVAEKQTIAKKLLRQDWLSRRNKRDLKEFLHKMER